MKQFVRSIKQFFIRFLFSHAGKATAGVFLADGLIGFPFLLSWMAAGYLIYWSLGHLRASFRSVDATPPARPATEILTVRPEEPEPALDVADILDRATSIDAAPRRSHLPVMLITD